MGEGFLTSHKGNSKPSIFKQHLTSPQRPLQQWPTPEVLSSTPQQLEKVVIAKPFVFCFSSFSCSSFSCIKRPWKQGGSPPPPPLPKCVNNKITEHLNPLHPPWLLHLLPSLVFYISLLIMLHLLPYT